MDPTVASNVLDQLTRLTDGALISLLPWSYALFATLFCWRFINSFWLQMVAGNGVPDWEQCGQMMWSFCMGSIIIGAYPLLLFPFMETFRNMGMYLGGSTNNAPDIGEVAAYAETITAAIDETIRSMFTYNPLKVLQQAELILTLRGLNFIISFLQVVLALIGVWMYAKFCIGAVMGNSIIGTIGWNETRHYGLTGMGYSLWSIIALMALAFIQGASEFITSTALLGTSQQVTIPTLKTIAWTQGVLVLLAGAAPSVVREVMQSFAGSSGNPDINIARHAGMVGAAGSSFGGMVGGGGGGANMIAGGGGNIPPLPGGAPQANIGGGGGGGGGHHVGGGGGGAGGGGNILALPGTAPSANAVAGSGGGAGWGGVGRTPSGGAGWASPSAASGGGSAANASGGSAWQSGDPGPSSSGGYGASDGGRVARN